MVRVWITDVSLLYQEDRYREYYEKLPSFRKKKADALRQQTAKAQSVGAWSLWEKIRAQYGLSDTSVFNLSHSGTYAMCAAELEQKDVQVGCDLEEIKEIRLKVAQRYFCKEEYQTILAAEGEEAQRERFYRYWVLKESFMKAVRKGMALPLDSFSVRLGEPPVLIKQPQEYGGRYCYREFRIEGLPYKMAVCTTDEVIDPKIHTELGL